MIRCTQIHHVVRNSRSLYCGTLTHPGGHKRKHHEWDGAEEQAEGGTARVGARCLTLVSGAFASG
jgi:hypothetical protein